MRKFLLTICLLIALSTTIVGQVAFAGEIDDINASYDRIKEACKTQECVDDAEQRRLSDIENLANSDEPEDSPIPQDELDRIDEQHAHEVAACDGDAECLERADSMKDAAMDEAQQAANAATVNEGVQDAQAEQQERINESEKFDDNCFGYPHGDTKDSSDFALKIDCILDTGDQNQAYFEDDTHAPIENVIIRTINYLITTIGSVSMLLIVVAGIMMITSPGNEQQRSKATEILTTSVIALVIAFSSYIIVNAVQGLFY